MVKWQDLKIEGIANIEKCVAEFDVGELKKTPWAKFKVKIYESQDGRLTGYTNLRIKDESGDFSGGVGYGNTVEETLEDTILYFLKVLNGKEIWSEEDFQATDPYDF
jgi:hypothetical protein